MATHSNVNMKCALVNIQSVRNKTFNIRDLINDECLDILAITETWLSDADLAVISEMTPDTHTFLHTTRQTGRGGGVGVFASKAVEKIRKCVIDKPESYEVLQVQCEVNGNRITLIVIYRPPKLSMCNFIYELKTYLDTIDMVSSNVIICGDFNVWMDDLNARYVADFVDMVDSFNLVNVVNEPTSIGGHTIDLILVDKGNNFLQDVQVENIFSISPVHKLISFTMQLAIERKQKKKIIFRSKRNFDPDLLLGSIYNNIASQRFESCVHGTGTLNKCECLTCFDELTNSVAKDQYEIMCPIIEKEVCIRDSAPWYNSVVDCAKKEKKRKERKWRRHRTELSRLEYVHARNNERKVIIARKREYYQNKTEQAADNGHKLYKILDNLTGKRKCSKLPEGFSDDKLANDFVQFFEAKIHGIIRSFNDYSRDDLILETPVPAYRLTSFNPITSASLKLIMKKMKPTYCINDPLPFGELFDCDNFDLLIEVLLDLINFSILSHTFPFMEKRAIVKPILKGALDPQCLTSFRPVSNLTFLSKVMENVILEQLSEHLQLVEAIPDCQSAYRRLYSTETALCSVVNDMHELMDEGKCGILILLDLSAAFDTVVHDVLLHDCEKIGIEGAALAYIKSYLENRTYCVQIGETLSEVKQMERGVPQGSVLGPILFCIYIIELSCLLAKHGVAFKLFADDTQFYLSLSNVQNTEAKISAVMLDIGRWMKCKQLKLNNDKTECLVIGRNFDISRSDVRHLQVNGEVMNISDGVKNLGVFIDKNLSFSTQIQRVVCIANYHMKNLSFVKKYLDESQMLTLIHNHVISRLDYCNSLYYGVPDYLLRKLQLVMNRAARLIKGLSRRDRITPALIDLHWLPIKARIVFKRCVMVYQSLKSGSPRYIRELLIDFRVNTNVILRHSTEEHRLAEPRFNNDYGRRAFSRNAPRLFNGLPPTVKQAENVEVFKKKLKTYLFGQCYNMEDMTVREPYRW